MSVKVGIVGMGFMGGMHFDAYAANPRARVAAIADIDPKKLRADGAAVGNIPGGAAKRDLGGVRTFRRLDDMLECPGLDVIDITLPTYLHLEHALKALNAGKHVICEKPMALNARDAEKMVGAARKAGKQLLIGQCIRFWPAYEKAREIVKSGRYGRVVSARFVRLSPTPGWAWRNWILDPRKSGSAAFDLHIHDSDFVLHLFGKPKSVTSRAGGRKRGTLEHITSVYDYGSDLLVMAEGAWEYAPGFPFEMSFTIAMERATLACTPDLVLKLHLAKGGSRTIKVPKGDGWTRELKHFVDCIARNEESDVLTPESAVESVRLVEAEIRSARTRKTVRIRF